MKKELTFDVVDLVGDTYQFTFRRPLNEEYDKFIEYDKAGDIEGMFKHARDLLISVDDVSKDKVPADINNMCVKTIINFLSAKMTPQKS